MQNNNSSNSGLLDIFISPIRTAKRLFQREQPQRILKYDEDTPLALQSLEFPPIVITEPDK